MFFNDDLVTLGFNTFNNWANEFCIKIPRLVCEDDLNRPIQLIIMFPIKDYEQVLDFGVGHVLKICHYLYVHKLNGHEMTNINIEFYDKEG